MQGTALPEGLDRRGRRDDGGDWRRSARDSQKTMVQDRKEIQPPTIDVRMKSLRQDGVIKSSWLVPSSVTPKIR